MNKPLKDWTLDEMRKYCDETLCEDCRCFCESEDSCLFAVGEPHQWHLSESHRWTERDIEDARAIKRVFKWATDVNRGTDNVYVRGATGDLVRGIDTALLPSLRRGEIVTLDEILGTEGK